MCRIPDQPANGPVTFTGERYATRGVSLLLDLQLQQLLWRLIDQIPPEKRDYLQTFKLTARFDMKRGILQHIVHQQAAPPFRLEVDFPCYRPVCCNLFVIDDSNGAATMLLTEEY